MNPPTTRFALLRHEVPAGYERASHWDLLLEHEGIALTWELADLPLAWCQQGALGPLVALRLPDHRLHYLDYEGPVSGDRGWVTRQAGGTCRWESLQPDSLRVQLTCPAWSTQVSLVDLQADNRWHLDILAASAL